ncbi:hypothetical protein GJAV_G00136990 [Gymnothorax javanicus]|nr:hypothetical protein GJAV_G00136990 [Gymnothorax javanicus]
MKDVVDRTAFHGSLSLGGMSCTGQALWRRTNSKSVCYVLLSVLQCLAVPVEASFMHNFKVNFSQSSGDHWTLLDRTQIPLLAHMTVCMHMQVIVPGEWTAYTYSRPNASKYDLALKGDKHNLYIWLLGFKHIFPVRLHSSRWYHVCLKRDTSRRRVSLEVDGSPSVHAASALNIPTAGELILGSKHRSTGNNSAAGAIELYLFRVWDNISKHGACNDGNVVSWKWEQWDMGNHPPLQDESLPCGPKRVRREVSQASGSTASVPFQFPSTSSTRLTKRTQQNVVLRNMSSTSPMTVPTTTTWSNILVTSQPTFHGTVQSTPLRQLPTTVLTTQPISSAQLSTTVHISTQFTSGSHIINTPPERTASTQPSTKVMTSTEHTSFTPHSNTLQASTLSESYTETPTRFITATELISSSSQSIPFTKSPATSQVALSGMSVEPLTNSPLLNCSFSDLCANESAFYWMVLEVQSERNLSSTEDIKIWLQRAFSNFTCVLSDVRACSPVSSVSREEETCKNDNETYVSLFQGIEVECKDKENQGPKKTQTCMVLLQLSRRIDACVLHQALETNNISIQAHVEGNVERVGKGLCTREVMPDYGVFEKCESTLPSSYVCHSEGLVTCERNPETVVIPVESLDPGFKNCTSDDSKEEHGCDCSAFCGETAAYYTLTLGITDSNITFTEVGFLIRKLDSTLQTCNRTDHCTEIPGILQVFQECFGMGAQINNCTVVLKLVKAVDICELRATLVSLIEEKDGIFFNGSLTRVAICGWPAGSADTLSMANFTWISTNYEYSHICRNNGIICFNCKSGETLGVPLTEVCMPDVPFHTVTTLSPNTTTQYSTFDPLQNLTGPTILFNKTEPPLDTTGVPHPTTVTGLLPYNTANTTQIAVPSTTADAESQAEQLLDLTRDVLALNSSQVEQLVNQLEGLLSGPNVSLALGRTVVTIVSNLLNASVDTLASSSTRIIGLVDIVGLKLVIHRETETILSDSVALAVKKVDGSNLPGTTFSITNPSNVQISSAVRAQISSSPQGSITLPPNFTTALSPQQQLLASRVQFNFYQKSTVYQDRNLQGRRLNSGILGATVANLSISNLTDKIFIRLRNIEPVPANFVASCVFWDFSWNDGSGGWNPSGCSVENSTNEETSCSCNHLTSFAVLLDISREGITNRVQAVILTFITNIGCGISAIFISITLLTYLAFEKLRKDIPSKILIQLCTALLLLNLTFLLDSWLALYPEANGLCISTAFFLHYFLLVSFTWMCLEAIHMYLALIKVFNTYVSRYMLKFSLAGWGIPLLVVIIVIAIDKGNYGLISFGKFRDGSSDEFCWLANDVAFYLAVVTYFCLVFLVNLTIMCAVWLGSPSSSGSHGALLFFAWGPVNLAFMYLFAIFNSLQGFFIFIFHCAIKENVRRQWRVYLCCGKLRPSENTEWSRTATHRRIASEHKVNKTTFFGSSNSLQSSNTSSSSFLASDSNIQSNGIGGIYEDRQISALEETNGDVVLNDIHSRHRAPLAQ